jgi:Undecaprenyl-phosphate glucose phosphotransferase
MESQHAAASPLPGVTAANTQHHTALSESIIGGLTASLDILIIGGLGLSIYAIHPGGAAAELAPYLAVIAAYAVLVLQSFSMAGLYRFDSIIHPVRQVRKSLSICLAVFGFLVIGAFALKMSAEFSRIWTFAWFVSTTLMVQLSRFAIFALVRRWAHTGQLSRNIVVYGAGEHGGRLVEYLESLDQPWNRIVGVFDQRQTRVSSNVGRNPVLGNLGDMVDFIRHHSVDEALISLPGNCEERIRQILHLLAPLPVNVRLCSEFIGTDFMNRRISHKFGIPMLDIMDKPVTDWAAFSKTLFDFTLGAIFLLLGLPLFLVIAACIKLDSRGPVFFRQNRYGFNNKLISVYKFRTMYFDQTDKDAEKLTCPGDSRVTRVGGFLRRFSLDELPQLFNIFTGEMSVVGPRPHAVKAKAAGKLYEDVVDYYAVRHKVKPGITGWAQVKGWRGNTDTEESLVGRVDHDLYYIENWSMFFDAYILLLTVRAVIVGENSY